jgi:hypothetical protein
MAKFTIKGTITGSDGTETEFLLHPDLGSWSQWGPVPQEALGERVEYLDAMQQGLSENSDYYSQPAEDEEA